MREKGLGEEGSRAGPGWDAGGLQLFPVYVRADQSSLTCLQPPNKYLCYYY